MRLMRRHKCTQNGDQNAPAAAPKCTHERRAKCSPNKTKNASGMTHKCTHHGTHAPKQGWLGLPLVFRKRLCQVRAKPHSEGGIWGRGASVFSMLKQDQCHHSPSTSEQKRAVLASGTHLWLFVTQTRDVTRDEEQSGKKSRKSVYRYETPADTF